MTAGADERPDEALFAAYASGDEQAFSVLFDRFSPLLARIIRRRISDRAIAQDLLQQTFFQVHRARRDFKRDRKLRPWIVTICMNVVRQHLRRSLRWRQVQLAEDGAWAPTQAPHDAGREEDRRRLHHALSKLNDGQRRAIELHWLEGMPFPEVAEVLGISVSAVKVRAHRGYARLREHLTRSSPRDPK